MTEENQRLSADVKRVGEKERHLVSHKQAISTEIVGKKTSMQEHFNNMERLNKRISQIVLDKVMLEKQIEVLTKEIKSTTFAVEHSATKIEHMETETTNQERAFRTYRIDCDKLRSTNQYLSERLEKVSRSKEPEINQPTNLLLEIERSVPDYKNIIETKDNATVDESCEDIDIESDEEICELDTELDDLKNEVFSAYQQSMEMCATLRQGKSRRDLTQSLQTSQDLQSVMVRIAV